MAPKGEIFGYAVTRAHHSDVGGMRPGSMPSDSREIYQEGIVIPPLRLVSGGEYVDDVLDLMLANVRTPDIRRGDLRAQIAANRIAEERVGELIERRGKEIVLAAFDEVIAYTEKRTREAIRELPDGVYSRRGLHGGRRHGTRRGHPHPGEGEDGGRLDNHRLRRHRRRRAGQRQLSAAGDALGLLLRPARTPPKDIPANAGTYVPLEIRAREGSLVNAK